MGLGSVFQYLMLRLVTEQPTREDRDRIIAEMKKMLAGYLFPA